MKQITQNELIELIREKKENAMKEYEAIRMGERWTPEEGQILGKERNKAYIDAYQDLICYLDSVEIVPEVKQEEKKCECYDPVYKRCNGTRERDECYCNGYKSECTHYPEKRTVATTPTTEAIEELRKIDLYKLPITPYVEPKVEPLRDDRFGEFERTDRDGYSVKEMVDAKSIVFIRFYDNNKEKFVVEMWSKCGFVNEKTFIEEARAKAYYNDLVAWWKYWKVN